MKMHINKFFLLVSLIALPILANADSEENTGAIEQGFGIIDAVYPNELSIIIDDNFFSYTDESSFKSIFGRNITDIKKLTRGSYAKYHFVIKGKNPKLIDLRVISKLSYEHEQTKQRMEDY